MRTIRQNPPGVVHHFIWRFVDRDWFFTSDEERTFYLHLLGRALADCDWRLLAYALMSSHIHMVLVAGLATLASWARRVNSPFADWMNQRHDRIGSLFTKGPKDYAIAPHREGAVIAYVHNNPVSARVVARAADSSWTSHRAYLGLVEAPDWLHVQEGLQRSGFDDAAVFDNWVDATPGDSGEVDASAVRRAARARGQIEVGTPMRDDDANVVPLVGRPFAHVRPDPQRLVELAAAAVDVSVLELCSRRRNPTVVAGRRITANVAQTIGMCAADVASALGVTTEAVTKMWANPIAPELRSTCREVMDRMLDEMGGSARRTAKSRTA